MFSDLLLLYHEIGYKRDLPTKTYVFVSYTFLDFLLIANGLSPSSGFEMQIMLHDTNKEYNAFYQQDTFQ